MEPPDGELRARLASLADPMGLLQEMFASAPMALQIYARDGRCVLVNPAHTELFGGVPPPEYNIFSDNIIAERGLTEIVRRAFDGERISVPAIWYDIRELRNLPPTMDVSGGRRIAISSELVPLRDAKGQVTHVLLVFLDETGAHESREIAEAAAVAAERRAAQAMFLAEAGRTLASSLDLDLTLSRVAHLATPAFADFCVVDLVGDDGAIRRLVAVHADPAQQPVLDEMYARFPPTSDSPQPGPRAIRSRKPELVAEANPISHEAHTLSSEHQALIVKLGVRSHVAFPLLLGTRTLGAITLAFVGDRRYTADDLPFFDALASRAAVAIENARLYRAADAARAEAEMANRAKDEFLAMLGHELRNPLAPIVTALELSQAKGKTREYAIIERQVGHLRRLVDDLLDVSRITRGTLELELAPVDLADAIADGIEAARPLIDTRKQQLVVSVARDLFVLGDRVRLAQAVTNLVTNAARYSQPGGRIEITATRHGSEHVVLVRDNGIGMTAELIPRVFEIFTRGDHANGRAAGGLGLGLAIVKSLTEKHGGRVTARSDGPGRGSELELRLPAIEVGPTMAAPEPALPGGAHAGRVLIVDDNEDAAVMLGEGLKQYGLTPMVAHDAATALALARTTPPRVAIVDIGMPGMNGYELAEALHDIPGLDQLAVVALTGYGQAADRYRSERAGFAAHFVKPVSTETLMASLELLL